MAPKVAAIEEKIRRATQKKEKEASQAQAQMLDSAMNVGASLFGALFGGRKTSSIGKVASAARSANRAMKERGDVAEADENLSVLIQQKTQLEAELHVELAKLAAGDTSGLTVETLAVVPKKADISLGVIGLVWLPFDDEGPAF